MIDKAVMTNVVVKNNPLLINTTANIELDLSIVEELKWSWASISLFELAKIAQFRKEIVNVLPRKMPKLPHYLITSIDIQDSLVEGAAIGHRSRSVTPPLLLTFEIFNNNVHKYMVDLGPCTLMDPKPRRVPR